jgi:hypothetical protein
MDHEHPERRHTCDHDDVMCHGHFFDKTLRAHLDRQRLHAFIDGKQHWVFVVTPECAGLIQKLSELCLERCGEEGAPVLVTNLPLLPMFICFPRGKLALEELSDIVDFGMGSREVYESQDFITITSMGIDMLNRVVSNWMGMDHLVN